MSTPRTGSTEPRPKEPWPKDPRATDLVTSRRNPAVVEARKLEARKHRRAQERFLVEGLQLLHMALEAGHRPLDAFFAPAMLDDPSTPPAARALPDRLAGAGARLHAVTADVLASLCERDDLQGVVATFATFGWALPPAGSGADGGATAFDAAIARRQAEGLVPRPGTPGLVLVLDRLQDPGNLGALIRTADAAGADAIVLVEPCVDPFDPRAVRGSMGSLFTLPLGRASDAEALAAWLRGAGYRIVGADAHGGELWGVETLGAGREDATDVGQAGRDDDDGPSGVALVLGNEARGLSPDIDGLVVARVRLPIVGRAESLNVAVAGGILMYAWLREALRRMDPATRGS